MIVDRQNIADRLGVVYQTVYQWGRMTIGFPEPSGMLGRSPYWEWAEVEAWAKKTGRLT